VIRGGGVIDEAHYSNGVDYLPRGPCESQAVSAGGRPLHGADASNTTAATEFQNREFSGEGVFVGIILAIERAGAHAPSNCRDFGDLIQEYALYFYSMQARLLPFRNQTVLPFR
jgi:hypothetical protein